MGDSFILNKDLPNILPKYNIWFHDGEAIFQRNLDILRWHDRIQ